jgi:hypothetical protein
LTTALSPKLAFARTADTPAPGTITFYDGYFPALKAASYTITVKHTLTGTGSPVDPYSLQQAVLVQGPEFTLNPGVVQQQYPPAGGTDVYGQSLAFVVLADPSLPWERALVPGADAPGPGSSTPWTALVLFAEGEIPVDPQTGSPLSTSTVQQLLAPDPNTLKPSLPDGWVPQSAASAQCQTLLVPGATFTQVMPSRGDLPFLAHCRGVNVPGEDPVLVSTVLANRLPLAAGGAPTRYYAHLVSLEGFADYLGPGATPIPDKTGPGQGGPMDVQVVSLANWTFVSLPEQGLGFAQLVQGLIDGQAADATLTLPLPRETSPLPAALVERVRQGYVPVDFVTGAGPQSFAWYRGPLTPAVPQPLPQVGNPATPVAGALSSDVLMIYLAEQGLFDLSYAAAWQAGRALALADAGFARAVRGYRLSASRALAMLTQRASLPHLAGVSDPAALLAPGASRRQLGRLMAGGLGRAWTNAVSAPPAADGAAPPAAPRASLSAVAPQARTMLASDDAVAAIADRTAAALDPVAVWIARLRLFFPLPFSLLVPSDTLLPVESIRFFYVDPGWQDALQAGAMSLGIQGSRDVALQQALAPRIDAAVAASRPPLLARPAPATDASAADDGTPPGTAPQLTGMLIRSALVSGWPTLVVTASAGGSALTLVRDESLGPTVRFCLFDGVPDSVTLAEPYQGLRFGAEDEGVALRAVSGNVGAQIPGKFIPPTGGFAAFLSTYAPTGGVLKVSALAADLAAGVEVGSGFGPGEFALQMVRAPEKQDFPSATS